MRRNREGNLRNRLARRVGISAVAGMRILPRRRWRAWVAWCAAFALVFPAVLPLPWTSPEVAASGSPTTDAGSHRHAEPNRHLDYSEIPGSPTHPPDHNCFPCQVLKHLSRGLLPQPEFVAPTLRLRDQPLRARHIEPEHAAHIGSLPPARAPPAYLRQILRYPA